MDKWDVAILIVTGYVAVTTLVRLMINRRNNLLDRFRRQMAEEKNRNKRQEKTDRKEKAA